jgi:hypothetical protein
LFFNPLMETRTLSIGLIVEVHIGFMLSFSIKVTPEAAKVMNKQLLIRIKQVILSLRDSRIDFCRQARAVV